jgi:hypothetical protein
MYWIVSNTPQTRTLVIPYYSTGEQLDFSAQLVIEDGEVLDQAYLSVLDSGYVGLLKMRIDPITRFVDVGGVLDSTAYLGRLVGPYELSLVFRIETPSDFEGGEHAISVGMFHGQSLPGAPVTTLCGSENDEDYPTWAEEESDSPLWNDSEDEAPFWESGSMCRKKEYMYLPPGETLTKWNLVQVGTDGTEEAYKLAGCFDTESEVDEDLLSIEKVLLRAKSSGTLGEAHVVGIIDDDCVNYVHALDGTVVTNGGYYVYWQGGNADGSITDRVWRFNYLTRLWDELAEGQIPGRIYHSGVLYGGKIYIWGGRNAAGQFLNSIYAFDLTSKTWTSLTSGGTARCLHAAYLVGSSIHFVGGVNHSGAVVSSVDVYSITNNSWSTGVSAPSGFESLDISISPLARSTWQVCNGSLFYGGSTSGRTEEFWTYNGSVWGSPTPLADRFVPGRGVLPNVPFQSTISLPQHFVRLQPFGTDSLAEWVGLPTTDGVLADVWNEDSGSWKTVNIGERRALTQGFCTDSSWTLTIGQQAWLSGSIGQCTTTRPDAGWMVVVGEAVSSTTFCFAPQVPSYELTRWKHSAWTSDGVRYSYEFGGDDGSGLTNRLRRLDWLTMQWTELTPGCTARKNAGIGTSAGFVYVLGGKDSDGTLLNTMCVYNSWTDTWTSAADSPFTAGYDQVVVSGPWENGGFWAGEWTLNYCYKEDSVVLWTPVENRGGCRSKIAALVA